MLNMNGWILFHAQTDFKKWLYAGIVMLNMNGWILFHAQTDFLFKIHILFRTKTFRCVTLF
jgi:hypothetical protein